MRIVNAGVAVVATLFLHGCGSGGGEAPQSGNQLGLRVPLPVSTQPATVESGAVSGGAIRIPMAFQSGGPAQIYADVVDSEGVFSVSDLALVREQDGYAMFLPIPAEIAAERHSGTLTIRLCQDPACTTSYGSARQVPYTIQVYRILAGQPGIQGQADGVGNLAQFTQPSRIAIDDAGNAYVTQPTLQDIRKITPAGEVTTFYARAGTPEHAIPNAIAVNAAGDVYFGNDDFATDAPCRVSKRAVDGTVTTFADACASGLEVDGSGNVWTANITNGDVRQFAPDGTQLRSRNFVHANDVAVDAAGNAYVSNSELDRISRWTPDDAVSALPSTGWWSPWDLAFEGSGNLVASSFVNMWIIAPAETTFIAAWRSTYVPGADVFQATGIAIGPDGKRMVVSDGYNHVVMETTLP